MTVQTTIDEKLRQGLDPVFLAVENESHMHGGPATESHFKITLVSARFTAMRAVSRHREIYRLLADELTGGVHALALHTYTPDEWQARTESAPASPDCRGGSKVAD